MVRLEGVVQGPRWLDGGWQLGIFSKCGRVMLVRWHHWVAAFRRYPGKVSVIRLIFARRVGRPKRQACLCCVPLRACRRAVVGAPLAPTPHPHTAASPPAAHRGLLPALGSLDMRSVGGAHGSQFPFPRHYLYFTGTECTSPSHLTTAVLHACTGLVLRLRRVRSASCATLARRTARK